MGTIPTERLIDELVIVADLIILNLHGSKIDSSSTNAYMDIQTIMAAVSVLEKQYVKEITASSKICELVDAYNYLIFGKARKVD